MAGGCFRISQAADEFNTAQDAAKAGTSTDSDRAKAFASVKGKLDAAVLILPAGALHDLSVKAATGIGQARVALLEGGNVATGVNATISALDSANPMCAGK